MKRGFCRILLFILCAIFGVSALAARVQQYSAANIPVANASTSALQQALRPALKQVLVRMSGNDGVMTVPAVQNDLGDLDQWVLSYRYYKESVDGSQPQLFAHISFDKNALVNLLKQAQQPIWDANRPLMLVWLSIDDSGAPVVLSSTADNNYSTDVKDSALRRGLPFILPIMDITDQANINTNPSEPFALQKLRAVEKRYHAHVILAANIAAVASNWQGQWMLDVNGQPFQWSNTAPSPAQLISDAFDNAANILANQFAVIDNSKLQTGLKVEIVGVNSLSDYSKALRYLRGLNPVTGVSVGDMQAATLMLNVNVLGGAQALNNALEVSGKMTPMQAPTGQSNDGSVLYYQWGTPEPSSAVTTVVPSASVSPLVAPQASTNSQVMTPGASDQGQVMHNLPEPAAMSVTASNASATEEDVSPASAAGAATALPHSENTIETPLPAPSSTLSTSLSHNASE